MTATLIAVQNVQVNGQTLPPNTVFSIDDINAAELLATGQVATSAAQATANAGQFPLTPTDDPYLTNS